jgi:HD-GYP domain-containing protein (c-di-GMP phosphodiesterase class II)
LEDDVTERLANAQTLRYAQELQQLHRAERAQRRRAEEALASLDASYALTVRALAATLELRDDITGGHAERVTSIAMRLAATVAPELTADPTLEYAFLLHDLGKVGIPDSILLKPGPLTEVEFEQMRRHPSLGAQIVGQIPYLSGLARDVAFGHHERWDGTGYPNGVRAEEIPTAARIFSLADAFDAMTNDRPYRRALSVSHALTEIAAAAGSQFDPAFTESFVTLAERRRLAS